MSESFLENKTFDEVNVGDSAKITRKLTRRDIELFAVVSGDVNPAHLDDEYADKSRFHGIIAHGMLSGAIFSAVLGTKLPGPGTIYLEQGIKFLKPVRPDDTVEVTLTITAKDPEKKTLTFNCIGTNQKGQEVIIGIATVLAPTEKIRYTCTELPEVNILHHDRMSMMIEKAKSFQPLRTAVVHPCDANSLGGAHEARQAGLIEPVLVGPEAKIRAAAEAAGIPLDGYEIVNVEHSHAAAIESVAMARNGKVGALMKGSLHTDEIMGAAVHREYGLRTESRMSHVFVMDVPTYKFPLLISDAALNIAPDLECKKFITQNAIYMAHAIGIFDPKVAILAAAETVNLNMPATLDAAALCKMADRGQIVGATLDGPLAFDNAISTEAARVKGIHSAVAGQADILIVPNIEAGNMLAKQLAYLGAAEAAGIVLGAKVPIMLTSRADAARSRLASAALAVLANIEQKSRLGE
ncbi:MAG: bifunctional enoyl-CoA hydratase/phosphate acetyltransferase [Proteobacteria bacterium]|jgi:phosphotransacetylase/acyl dehydratase|nr:bifunctional enoyl-CoA hydratase/phosphate acetyltransferase [Alphaproteobacteria bacterium]NCC04026.1 bifunctional enoyl-CoA hydratase/phosphate acetyltransferase [Pseudomonadota bacterium]